MFIGHQVLKISRPAVDKARIPNIKKISCGTVLGDIYVHIWCWKETATYSWRESDSSYLYSVVMQKASAS